MLTRLEEPGADGFTMIKIVGDGSIVVSRQYLHPTPPEGSTSVVLAEGDAANGEVPIKAPATFSAADSATSVSN